MKMNTSSQPTSDQQWPVRRQMTLGLLGALVLIGGFGSWAVFANISGAVISSGQIEVDQNRQVVQHPDGGVVEAILTEEGALVEEGSLLIRLDPSELQSELTIVENQLFELLARDARLKAERDGVNVLKFDPLLMERVGDGVVLDLMDGQTRLFAAREESLERETEQLNQQKGQILKRIEGIDAQQAALVTQISLIKEELANQTSLLKRGLTSASRVLELQRQEANLLGQSGELIASAAQAQEQITEIEIQVSRLKTTRREEAITQLRDLQYNQLDLRERRRALVRRLERLEIRAPVSGVVYGLSVFAPRSVISPADPVLFLVPQDRPLIITTQVEITDIDQVNLGQDVALRFSALDQRTTPELYGNVVSLSADAFQNEQTGASFYRAEIALNEGENARLPEGTVIIPGMPVEAFIRTQDRSPLNYLLKPLTDYFAKIFRET